MNWLERLYCWLWYHVEALWIKSKWARRPFTYMMRDFTVQHRFWGILIIILEVTGICFLTQWKWYAGLPVMAFYFFLAGHLWWGTPYKPDEQEDPPYTE